MVITYALSGVARSAATPAAYTPLGRKVLKFAQSGVARSDATRSDYHSSMVFISIAGIERLTGVLSDSSISNLSITDALDNTPSRGTFDVRGFVPVEGQEVIIHLGSINNLKRFFAGQILAVDASITEVMTNHLYQCSIIDYHWGLDKFLVNAQFTGQTASDIAISLISSFAPGYTYAGVELGLSVIEEISFTDQTLSTALTTLAKRVNAHWSIDYFKDLQFYVSQVYTTPPTILNGRHASLRDLHVIRDLSQIVTRVFSQGGGSRTLAAVDPGETILPLVDVELFDPDGGLAVTGSQRFSYTGKSSGGGGTLIGVGSGPAAAPVLGLSAGTGIESGSHDYAVTFKTAGGESLPSPLATIVVGALSAPSSGVTFSSAGQSSATGPEIGLHDYAVTFTTATGETLPSAITSKTTPTISNPTVIPTTRLAGPVAGAGLDDGTHEYAVSVYTESGETLPSPISAIVTAQQVPAPSMRVRLDINSAMTIGSSYRYIYTLQLNGGGESNPSDASASLTCVANTFSNPCWFDSTTGNSFGVMISGTYYPYYRMYRSVDGGTFHQCLIGSDYNQSDASIAAAATPPGGGAPHINQIEITNPFAQVTGLSAKGIRVYRRSGGAGLKLLVDYTTGSIPNPFYDSTPNASLGAAPPVTNTAYQRAIIYSVPIGAGTLITGRKVYRNAVGGGGQLKLLNTIADNTGTTYGDFTADASLGANVPTSNTAFGNRVDISSIPIGGATVTQRKVYRTAVGSSQLKLLTTIANNTGATYADSTADASLGANVPTTDTSGIAVTNIQTNAGATELLIAGPGSFRSTGGWATVGSNQVIRYTGLTTNSLTGIPTSGPGSITATIQSGTSVLATPQLEGIPASGAGSLVYAVQKGDAVNLIAQVDDLDAQTALIAILGGDGIVEEVITGPGISYLEAISRAEALLNLRGSADIILSYKCRDKNTAAGGSVPVNLGAPFNLNSSFKIQQVVISGFLPSTLPWYSVTQASLVKFTFEDFLRLIRRRII